MALLLLDEVRDWEKLLHQAFLVGLQGFELSRLGGDQGVEAGEAVGDALLFGEGRKRQFGLAEFRPIDARLIYSFVRAFTKGFSNAVCVD